MLLNIGTKSEIGDLHSSVKTQENVVALNVPMDDTFLMQKTYCAKNLKQDFFVY